MLFKEILALFILRIIQNTYMQNAELLIVKAGGTYSYHWALPSVMGQLSAGGDVFSLRNGSLAHSPSCLVECAEVSFLAGKVAGE
jgi:hypothetical protein